jgi:hypothetical protein
VVEGVVGTERLASLVKRAAGALDGLPDRVVRGDREVAARTAAVPPVRMRIRIALQSRDSSPSTMSEPAPEQVLLHTAVSSTADCPGRDR